MLRPMASCIAPVLFGAVLAWGIGFVSFMSSVTQIAQVPVQADGIVALTGGADRIETAFHLLAEKRAKLLLVSGMGGRADLAELAHRAGLDPGLLAGEVTLGRKATSTRGNAMETASWARENGLHSLLVVTAGYHMPRALTELSRAMPEVALYPVPVVSSAMQASAGVRDPKLLRLMAEEYSKWLLARLGFTALDMPRDLAGLGTLGRTSHNAARSGRDAAG